MAMMNANAANWFVDRHVEEGRGNNVAFIEAAGQERTLSYGDLAVQSAILGGALNNAEVQAGERAAMLVLDQLEFPVIFWGAMKAGVLPVPINTLLATDVYRAILNDCAASTVFISAELLDVALPAAQATKTIKHIVVIGNDVPTGTVSFNDFIGVAEPITITQQAADDFAFWLYSSGSTGQPKGVRHVHRSLKETCDTYSASVLQLSESDSVYSAAKLFFAYGLGNALTFPGSVGATSILYNARPTPGVISEILATHRPTVFCGVPTLYAAMLHEWQEHNNRPDIPLRASISAGEALPADIGTKWKSQWGVDIMDGVGSTEMLHIFLSNKPDDVEYGTSGTAVNGYQVRLVDENEQDIEPGSDKVGELLVQGQSSAIDYWNQPEKSAATFQDGWTRTGDKYELNAAGRFIYCGRTDDMFKVSGIWVSPFEVEQALVSYSGVLEAAVVAHRDEDGLEKPKAFIVLASEQSAPVKEAKKDKEQILAELKDHVKEQIGKWKYPRWFEIVDDLPKTATGKIQRFKLRS